MNTLKTAALSVLTLLFVQYLGNHPLALTLLIWFIGVPFLTLTLLKFYDEDNDGTYKDAWRDVWESMDAGVFFVFFVCTPFGLLACLGFHFKEILVDLTERWGKLTDNRKVGLRSPVFLLPKDEVK